MASAPDGSSVVITHPEKMLFPEDGITKGELAAYYARVAEVMVPHLSGRPLTMERYPSGIGQPGFMQKDVSKGFPDWLQRIEVPKRGGVVHHPLISDARSLLWTANQNCITPHVWTSRTPDLFQPDLCVFDLDPSEDDPDALRTAALNVRDLLAELGLLTWVKTSGSKGFHIVVPLDGKAGFDEIAPFTHAVGAVLVKRHPEQFTQEFIKVDRGNRILIDTGRNSYGATYAAPYAVRPKPGAPVSAPCTWEEVERGLAQPQTFNLRAMPERLEAAGDLWADIYANGCSVREAMSQLLSLLGPEEWQDALAATRRRPVPRARKA